MNTGLNYIDFEPKLLEKSFWGITSYETVDQTLERANEWMRRNYSVEVLNVETVVLPNIYKKGNSTTNGSIDYYTGGQVVHNFQVIRIWYKA